MLISGGRSVRLGGIPLVKLSPIQTSFFLHLLTQEPPKVRAELPLLVQVSGSGIPNEGIYSELSGINSVGVGEEDQSKCPDSEGEPTTTPKIIWVQGTRPRTAPGRSCAVTII